MNRIAYIILIAFIVFSCQNSISEADRNRVTALNKKAVDSRMIGDLESAKNYYSQAIEIDQGNVFIRYELIGIYVEQDSLQQAFMLLEKVPEELKETGSYYQEKGMLYEYGGQKEQAVENFKKALTLTDLPKVEDEMDLSILINYAMLETLAGKKEQAVDRLNKTLELQWLTESNEEYLETFRNEFEFYQGNGSADFEPTRDIQIRTTNPDSLKSVLKESHINISGSSSINGNDTVKMYVSEKYRTGINKLNIRIQPNN